MGASEMLPKLIAYMIWDQSLTELRWIQSVDQHLAYTIEELKRYVIDPEFDQLFLDRSKPLGIFLVVQHPFEEDDYPDNEVFDDTRGKPCTPGTEVEYW